MKTGNGGDGKSKLHGSVVVMSELLSIKLTAEGLLFAEFLTQAHTSRWPIAPFFYWQQILPFAIKNENCQILVEATPITITYDHINLSSRLVILIIRT